MKKPMGFATGGVNVLDPGVGTGTYLLGIVEHALDQVEQAEGRGAVAARADVLGSALYGFEIMVGPYAVASLRLTRMLQQYGGHVPGDGVQVMLTDTLESPHEKIPELPLLYQPIGLEHKRAKRVKDTVPILVCLGNPPYDRHAAATEHNKAMTGGWVRWGESKTGKDAILEDFIEPVKQAGHGGDLKNLYNLYVYFWRWALWKTFEHDLATGPGIVSYISASSFTDGDAFLGMRRWMRRQCDEIWVIDLGGEGRGTRKDDNVFAIQTPVAITIAVRYGGPKPDQPAKTHYTRIEGKRAAKLEQLESLTSLGDLKFADCPDDWDAPFRPAGKGDYFNWPLLTDLMPWQIRARGQAYLADCTGACSFEASVGSRSYIVATVQHHSRDARPKIAKVCLRGIREHSQLPPLESCPRTRRYETIFVMDSARLIDSTYCLTIDWAITFDRVVGHRRVQFSSLFHEFFNHRLGDGPSMTVTPMCLTCHYFPASYGGKDFCRSGAMLRRRSRTYIPIC